MIELMDEMEQAAIQLRTFADKDQNRQLRLCRLLRRGQNQGRRTVATVPVRPGLLRCQANKSSHALDNVEASMGDEEGLKAAIRHLTGLAREAVTTFDRRYEMINGGDQ